MATVESPKPEINRSPEEEERILAEAAEIALKRKIELRHEQPVATVETGPLVPDAVAINDVAEPNYGDDPVVETAPPVELTEEGKKGNLNEFLGDPASLMNESQQAIELANPELTPGDDVVTKADPHNLVKGFFKKLDSK